MDNKQLEQLFLTVQKPGRYSGGEMGSVIKDKSKVDVRFAFCFPDTYFIRIGKTEGHSKIYVFFVFDYLSIFSARISTWL